MARLVEGIYVGMGGGGGEIAQAEVEQGESVHDAGGGGQVGRFGGVMG